ncbi:cell death abnormality protein 1-like [Haliotis rufescens]|uniref:cell death abnormality protein 1-like n=1 Tax=Haliotis rufescens TaxID=6454 RepID=UPI00201EECBD|nr:cell death abnormality protein 1-like [Haliotis rufescens]
MITPLPMAKLWKLLTALVLILDKPVWAVSPCEDTPNWVGYCRGSTDCSYPVNVSSQAYSHCKKTCKICESDTACADGYYGADCKPCVSRCNSSGQCEDKGSSECPHTCPDGYYSFNCNRRCPSNICAACNRWSGECEACKDGSYGRKCLKSCSEHCMDKTCDIDSGECLDGCEPMWVGEKCDVKEVICENCNLHSCTDDMTCLSGCKNTWYGPKCDQQCKNCKKKNCTSSGVCQAGCIAGFYGNTCTESCSEFCDKKRCNQTGYCNNCVSGRHGEDCTSICSTNCEGPCYRNTGKCKDCSVEWYGRFCTKSCDNCLNGCERKGKCKDGCKLGWYGGKCTTPCSNCFNGSCEQSSGHCERGCSPGYHGVKCDQLCGQHCKDSVCDQTSGLCIECKDTWYGANCTKECSSSCSNSHCVTDSTGSPECTHGCVDGKKGSYCQKQCPDQCYNCTDGNCMVCKDGFHGDDCRETCPANCEHGCQKDTGLCTSCKVGFFGTQCQSSCIFRCQASDSGDQFCSFSDGACLNGCIDTVYGTRCDQNCSDTCRDQTCNDKDGICTSGCMDGWKGPKCKTTCPSNCKSCTDISCTECNPSWFGDNCRRECPNCAEGNCIRRSGVCQEGCLPGFHGKKCDLKCATYCKMREGMYNFVYCDQNTGRCLDGCTDGHYGDLCNRNCSKTCYAHVCEQNSGKCNNGCQSGRLGDFCDRKCSVRCGRSTDRQCIQADGSCNLGCLKGWYGSHCDKNCSDGCYEGVCRQSSGLCVQGCEKGIMGDTCDTACPYGRYGYNCSGTCGYCRSNATCDSIHGNCSMGCAVGYGGFFCSDRMIIAPSPGPKSAGPISFTMILAVVAILLIAVLLVVGFLVYKRKITRGVRRFSISTKRDEDEYEMISVYPSVDTISELNEVPPRLPTYGVHERTENQSGNRPQVGEKKMDDDSAYYNVPLVTRVMTSTLQYHVKQLRKHGGFQKQFDKLPSGLLHNYNAAMKNGNRQKNIYKEVYAYDNTRVILELSEDNSSSDYINANFISGVDDPNKFVAAQGPIDKTICDFWLMIFQLRTSKIVMLTSTEEEGRGKCVRYWPLHGSGPDRHGNLEIECSTEETLVQCTIRTFKMWKILPCGSKASRTRIAQHFQFVNWPDRGMPPDVASLVEFYFKVKNTPTHGQGPMVVHCSDGVGRTGTFLALCYLIDEAKSSDTVDPFSCVKRMRHERVNMVRTLEQYEFLHNALIEALMARGTTVSTSDFKTCYDNLLQSNPETGISRLREQFETLQLMKRPYRLKEYRTAMLPENISKNRFKDILASDSHRPVLSSTTREGTDYINAVYLPGCRTTTAFLLTQVPMPDTVVDFWRMVIQTDSQTIVMLNDDHDDATTVGYYWPQSSRQEVFGTHLVEVEETENYECYSITTLSVRETEDDTETLPPRTIKLFRCHYWPQGQTTPESSLPLLAMIEAVEVWREVTDFKPVTVHCWDGVGRSGLFCVLSAILERLKIELDISILQTINQMRLCRPQLIQNFEHFQFCYKATKDYLDTFSVYSSLID